MLLFIDEYQTPSVHENIYTREAYGTGTAGPYLKIITQADGDGDGVNDDVDNCPLTCNVGQLDADSDGTGDVCDLNPGCGGCGQSVCEQSCAVDADGDGIFDYTDNCPDNCNVSQLDADGDGSGDVCDAVPGCGGCGQPGCEQEC
ncbi:MAG: hypothetical protein GY868_08445 [Deltaproteobacteria bacterium]|nr:hypothetical protein [Deltaproteobacteria bacterium]